MRACRTKRCSSSNTVAYTMRGRPLPTTCSTLLPGRNSYRPGATENSAKKRTRRSRRSRIVCCLWFVVCGLLFVVSFHHSSNNLPSFPFAIFGLLAHEKDSGNTFFTPRFALCKGAEYRDRLRNHNQF